MAKIKLLNLKDNLLKYIPKKAPNKEPFLFATNYTNLHELISAIVADCFVPRNDHNCRQHQLATDNYHKL